MAFGTRTHLRDRNGVLVIGGKRATVLAQRFETPLYVYVASRMRDNLMRLTQHLEAADPRMRVAYSLKANANPAVVRVFAQAGAAADAASIEELHIAKRAGMRKRIFTGVFSPKDEIRQAAKLSSHLSLDDASRLKHLPTTFTGTLCFRVNPGSGSGSHPGVVTGGKTKFGIPRAGIVDAYRQARQAGFSQFGLHMMVGSGERDWKLFVERVRIACDITGEIERKTGITISFIDIGGGLGIPYRKSEKPLDLERMAKGIAAVLRSHRHAPAELLFEPGRYLIGDAGVLLTSVTAVKEKPRRYVGVDAGMHTLIRPALYGAYHEVLAATKLRAKKRIRQTIVGPICETTDVLAEHRQLPELSEGDLVAILDTGAYGAAMSSGYGTRGFPKEILIDGARVKEITQEMHR